MTEKTYEIRRDPAGRSYCYSLYDKDGNLKEGKKENSKEEQKEEKKAKKSGKKIKLAKLY